MSILTWERGAATVRGLLVCDRVELRMSNDESGHPQEARYLSIIAAHEPMLRRYVAKTVRHDTDAATDLLAAIRARAWYDRAALIASGRPREMLIGYAREVCRAWVKAIRHEVPLDEWPHKAIGHAVWLASPARGTMSIHEAARQREWADRLLSQLTERQRLVVDFSIRWGMETSFLAALLDVKEATVRVHLFHARAKLREIVPGEPFPKPKQSEEK